MKTAFSKLRLAPVAFVVWTAFFAVGQIAGAQTVPELVYLKFNEGSGSVVTNDADPGVAPTLNLASAPLWVTPHLGASAVHVSGTNHIATGYNPSPLATSGFTIEFWIKASGSNNYYMAGDNSGSFRMYTDYGGNNGVYLNGGGFSPIHSAGIHDGNWHHVAFVYSYAAHTMTVYTDSVQSAQNTGQTANFTGTNLILLNRQTSWNNAVTFPIDDMRVWGYPRSAAEIQAAYNIELQSGLTLVEPASLTLPEATAGQTNYAVAFEADNGVAPYTWGGPGTTLPPWLQFSPTTGNPTQLVNNGPIGAAGSYTFDIFVEDSSGLDRLETFDLTVNPAPVMTGPASLPEITEGFGWPAPQAFSGSGGTGNLAWTVTGGPAGLAVYGAGVLNGPVDAGTAAGSPYMVTVTIEDENGVTDSIGPLSLTVNAAPAIAPLVPPGAPLGLGYSLPLTRTGGSAPFAWTATGTLGDFGVDPSDGTITGTPQSLGVFNFDVTVTDGCGATATISLSIEVIDPPTIQPLTVPTLTETSANADGLACIATGGDPAQYTWSHSGTLPAGLTLTNNLVGGEYQYVFSGAPEVGSSGTYSLDVMVTDASTTLTDTVMLSFTVNPVPAIDISGGTVLPGATETGAYSFDFSALQNGGTAPTDWQVGTVTGPAASLPGMTLATNGLLSSAAVTGPAGTYSVEVIVTDANGVSDSQTFTLIVNPVPAFPEAFDYAKEGNPFDQTLSVLPDTGTAPFVTTIVTTELDAASGIALTTFGGDVQAVGTPNLGFAGTYVIQLLITDANGVAASADVTFVIVVKDKEESCCGIATTANPSANALWLLALSLLSLAWLRRPGTSAL